MESIMLYSIEHPETEEGNFSKRTNVVKKKWNILQKYHSFALCVNEKGIRECFSWWYINKYSRPPVKITNSNGRSYMSFD